MPSIGVARANADVATARRSCAGLRASDRTKASVKEKGDDELLAHYGLAVDELLTNLGVLLIGRASERARLGSVRFVVPSRHLSTAGRWRSLERRAGGSTG